MKNLYDEDYYERGMEKGKSCYSNYRWIPELTIPMAARLIEYLDIKEEDKILDFGCAKGYLVKAFRLLHRQAYGYDVSEYALSCVPQDVKKYVSNEISDGYSWIISKDVFEHISYEEIDLLLASLAKKTKHLFAVIPLGSTGEHRYVVPAYELDTTHIIREDLEWWCDRFENAGFDVHKATYRVKHIKENWSDYDKGNGFFVLDSKIK